MRLTGVGLRPDSLSWAGLWSASLHGALLLVLVWQPHPSPAPQPAPASVEVELVRQPDTKKGAPPRPDQPAPAPAAPPAAAPTPTTAPTSPAPSPPPTADQAALPPPAAPPATPDPDVPMPTQPQAPQAAEAAQTEQPVVNLGNSDMDREAYSVSGANVVSEGPDARYHNLPPRYPRDAARAHLHGKVALRIHIDLAGDPGEIEVVQSSGVPSMDQSALTAVGRWRFKPAIRDGAPVESVYLIEFNFVDDER